MALNTSEKYLWNKTVISSTHVHWKDEVQVCAFFFSFCHWNISISHFVLLALLHLAWACNFHYALYIKMLNFASTFYFRTWFLLPNVLLCQRNRMCISPIAPGSFSLPLRSPTKDARWSDGKHKIGHWWPCLSFSNCFSLSKANIFHWHCRNLRQVCNFSF